MRAGEGEPKAGVKDGKGAEQNRGGKRRKGGTMIRSDKKNKRKRTEEGRSGLRHDAGKARPGNLESKRQLSGRDKNRTSAEGGITARGRTGTPKSRETERACDGGAELEIIHIKTGVGKEVGRRPEAAGSGEENWRGQTKHTKARMGGRETGKASRKSGWGGKEESRGSREVEGECSKGTPGQTSREREGKSKKEKGEERRESARK